MSKQIRKEIFELTGGRCYYCGCYLDYESFEIDHVVPKSVEWKDHNNRVPACHDCNACKGTLSVEEFRAKIRHLFPYMYEHDHKFRIIMAYYPIYIQETIPKIVFWFEKKGLEGARK